MKFIQKFKAIIANIVINPDDEGDDYKEKCLRRYIQYSLILSVTFLAMSIANIIQNSLFMLYTTTFGCLFCLVATILAQKFKNEKALAFSVCLVLCILFSAYTILGGNHGFAILWILLVPVAGMMVMDYKTGLMLASYFLVFLLVIFYTPARHLLQYDYGDLFSLRFPLLYLLCYVTSAFGFYRLQLYKITNNQQKKHLEEMRLEAENANEAKSRFLANMSHEIRTPINGILGMDAMLLAECQDPTMLEYGHDIQNAGQSLLSIVNDILDISKIEAGKMDLLPMEYGVLSIINDCYNLNQIRAKDKGLELHLEIDDDTPSILRGDEVRIKQIINNFLSNAIKYTKQGSVTLRVGYESVPDKKEILLKLSVEDTGIGIRQEEVDKLFDSFTRLEEKRNRNIEGTGLGLALTHSLVELMQGKIQVSSRYGEGSIFTAILPQEIVSVIPVSVAREQQRQKENQERQKKYKFVAPEAKILIVDDVDLNLKVAKGLIKDTQAEITTALSGMETVELAKNNHYDLIYLDQMMPKMDGVETLHQIREQAASLNKNTPVVVLTADAIFGAKEEYLKAGFDDYLSKPVTAEDLKDMLCKYLPEGQICYVQGDGTIQ